MQVHAAHFKVTSQISFDLVIDSEFIGTITVGLFGDDSPKTVENFRTICTKGINGKSYNGTKFHRVIDRFIIQGELDEINENSKFCCIQCKISM